MGNEKFVNILGYDIYKESMGSCIEYIQNFEKVHIVSGNPEVLYTGLDDERLFENFTDKSSVIIPDGVGVKIAAKMLGNPVKEKIAGIELMKNILKICEKEEKEVYFLGSTEEIINSAVEKIQQEYTKLNIVGYRNGFFDLDNCKEIVDEISKKKPYALFVAMGCPRQERFIVNNLNALDCKLLMGVGGSLDVIAGKVNRAPQWMIKLGLEWLYRVSKEPWRIKRLGSIPKFLYLVWKNK